MDKKDLKLIRDSHRVLRDFIKEKYIDKDGYANIDVYASKDNLFNTFSNPKDPHISEEIFDYINQQYSFIPNTYPVRVTFHSKDNLDAEYIENKLKERYLKQLADKDDELVRSRKISLLLLVIGLVIFSVYFTLENIPATKGLFDEVTSVIASFSVWEAADYAFLKRGALRIEYKNILQLVRIKVDVKNE